MPVADVLVLAVKPQQIREAVKPLLPLAASTVVVTIIPAAVIATDTVFYAVEHATSNGRQDTSPVSRTNFDEM
jgi:pyrroline-5-carboxylate reductase